MDQNIEKFKQWLEENKNTHLYIAYEDLRVKLREAIEKITNKKIISEESTMYDIGEIDSLSISNLSLIGIENILTTTSVIDNVEDIYLTAMYESAGRALLEVDVLIINDGRTDLFGFYPDPDDDNNYIFIGSVGNYEDIDPSVKFKLSNKINTDIKTKWKLKIQEKLPEIDTSSFDNYF